MLLALIARPSASTRLNVNTSPLAWGSIVIVKLLGGVSPAKMDRPKFSFQLPYAASAQHMAAIGIRRRVLRMRTQCASRRCERKSKGVGKGFDTVCTSLKIGVFSKTNGHGGIRCRS